MVAGSANASALSWWGVSLGAPPDSACWTKVDTSPLNDPVLTTGALTLATTNPAEAMYYEQSGSLLSVPSTWVIEAGLRVLAESHDPGPRWGAAIGFVGAPGVGNVLLLGVGHIMLWSGFGVEGPSAAIATADRVHDYRLEVEVPGAIKVFQDDVLVLTGSTIFDSSMGTTPYVYFGDGSGSGASTTQWTYFEHNGAASVCHGLVGVDEFARRSAITLAIPSPNPASREVSLRYVLPREARLELSIFDAAGRRVRRLEAGARSPGEHAARWDLIDETGRPAGAGLYFARLAVEGQVLTRRFVKIH
jgi:hypothetical protein